MAKSEDAPESKAEGGETAPKPSKKKLIIFAAAGLLLLLGGGGAAYFLLFSGGEESAAADAHAPADAHGGGHAGGHGEAKKDAGHADAHGKAPEAKKADAHGGGHGDAHGGGHAAAYVPGQPVFFDLPAILVNLRSDEKPVFLKLVVSLELSDPGAVKAVEGVLPRVVDQFQTYLRELRVEELSGSAATFRLKEELLRRVKMAASPAEVQDVLFKDMIIQ